MKLIIMCIALSLFSFNALAKEKAKRGVVYSLDDYKRMLAASRKVGERPSIPCPCIWNKARGRGEFFVRPQDNEEFECKEWNDKGKCDGIGTIKSQ